MKSLSVSDFKTHLAAYLRNVQNGETYLITEHRRPVAEVRRNDADLQLVDYPSEPFSLADIDSGKPDGATDGLAIALINEDRGD